MPSPAPKRALRFAAILLLVAVGTALAAVGGWRYARVSAPVNGPIILISIDTLRADHLPVYGYQKVKTPAIDRLAADGIVFDRAYSHAPQTLPAHASMLSGRLPFDTGVRDNVGFTVKADQRLLPQMLHDRGYTTGGVVSAYVLRKETGIGRGFDYFDSAIDGGSPETPLAELQRDGAESETLAERWLDEQRSGRAFLFLHLYEPHKPYTPPARFAEYAPYDGEIAYADEIVGRLIHYLQSHQLYERSTIILVSDHGEGLGDHGEQEHGLFVYDEAIHIPLIVKQADSAGAGRRVRDLVQQVDLVPTLLDFVKAPKVDNLPGRSLKPLLDGTGTLPEQAIYSEALYGRYHFGWSELSALTDDRYRYIKAPREELYDLDRDPQERNNIADGRVQARQALRGALDRLATGTAIPSPGDVSAEDRERLQALGYVGAQTELVDVPADALPDPKDKREILNTYREAVDLASERRWVPAIGLLQRVLKQDPEMADVWAQLATFAFRVGRNELALDAYRRFIKLKPSEPSGYIGAAIVLMRLHKLDEARQHADAAADAAAEQDARSRGAAHQLLAEIALLRHDADTARNEARLAEEADPTLPLVSYVDGRLMYDQGHFADALPPFQQAIAALEKPGAVQVPEIHYYVGDSLARLERYGEAEAEFSAELRSFPLNARARAGLAMTYQAGGRPDEAKAAIGDMLRIIPTPEAYSLAARLWTIFGNRRQADATRAEARRTFAEPARSGERAAR